MNPNLGKLAIALAAAAALSGPVLAADASDPITEADVLAAETLWGDGIVTIGEQFSAGGDYKAAAAEHIARLYAYGDGKVLFKPTKAAQDQFRETPDEALSYFVGGGEPEDHGFAIQPWSNVRFENDGVVIGNEAATAMGNYYFTDAKTGEEVKVEFTMAFKRAADGHLELFTHHSSLPYVPQH
ncbi:MAG: phosphoribosyl-AMP cyclohydrolase [Roseinatronobacter sp.]